VRHLHPVLRFFISDDHVQKEIHVAVLVLVIGWVVVDEVKRALEFLHELVGRLVVALHLAGLGRPDGAL